MRESFGGSFIINLILVFIVVFISFMAVTVSYAKAFRVKNQVINIVEQYQYSGAGDSEVENKIISYLDSVSYKNLSSSVSDKCNNVSGNLVNGVCIVPFDEVGARYYKIITYISIDFPFFNLSLVVPVSGETKTMYS